MNERELFEAKFPIPAHWIEFDEKRNKYFCPYVADGTANEYQARWEAWQASANREGYKLIPIDPTDEVTEYIADKCKVCGGMAYDIYLNIIGETNTI